MNAPGQAVSVVEIDIKDDAFKAFRAMFADYQKSLRQMPGDWQKIGAQSQAANAQTLTAVNKIAGATTNIQVNIAAAAKGESELNRHARTSVSVFSNLERTTKNIAGYLANGAFSLAKWAVFGGIAGVATGFFGAGAIGRGAASQRSDARGLRVSPGQLSAARIAYGPYFDPEDALGKIGDAQIDLGKRVSLTALGFGDDEIRKSPGDLLPEAVRRSLALFNQYGGTEQSMSVLGPNPILSARQLSALNRLPAGELAAAGAMYGDKSKELDVGDDTLRAGQRLSQTLETARQKIENVFIRALEPLSPQIGNLSKSIADMIEDLGKSPEVRKGLDELAKGIGSLSRYLSSGGLETEFRNLGALIGKIVAPADADKNFFQWFDETTNKMGADTWDFLKNGSRNPQRQAWDRQNMSPAAYAMKYPEPVTAPGTNSVLRPSVSAGSDAWKGKGTAAMDAEFERLIGPANLSTAGQSVRDRYRNGPPPNVNTGRVAVSVTGSPGSDLNVIASQVAQ